MDRAPAPHAGPASGAWPLWKRLAEQDRRFGRPWTFCGQVERTKWVTFTVTESQQRFAALMERFSGSPAGHGGLVTLKGSSWLLTFHLYPSPAFAAWDD